MSLKNILFKKSLFQYILKVKQRIPGSIRLNYSKRNKESADEKGTGVAKFSSQCNRPNDVNNEGPLKNQFEQIILKRGEPGKVHFGFIPFEWVLFFVPKTGYTGFYTMLFTFTTLIVSKEYYVLEEEFYTLLTTTIYWIVLIKSVGPHLARMLDVEIDEYETHLNDSKKNLIDDINKMIKEEERNQWRAEGQLLLLDAKRRNVTLQLEEERRKREAIAYNEIKHRLEYQARIGDVRRRFMRMNCIDWIFHEVRKAAMDLPEEIRDTVLNMSITDYTKIIDKSDIFQS